MAIATRPSRTTYCLELEQKLRQAPGLIFERERFTVNGFESVVTDPSTGQTVVLSMRPLEDASEVCPGCTHPAHGSGECAIIPLFTAERACRCTVDSRAWAGR